MLRFVRFAWLVLIYNLGVIAWGAYVRATGSGAGCGQHWPLCNGVVVPRVEAVQTLIEFSHRLTSGLALLSVVVMFFWARRLVSAGHPVRVGATLSLAFMVSEALLGAGLVLFQLVANDASAARAFAVAAHLFNTFLLLASLSLTVWWASGGGALQFAPRRTDVWRIGLGASVILVVSCSGAITALGDTLFPAESLTAGLSADLSATSHFLIRLRTIHPVLAVMAVVYLGAIVWQIVGKNRSARRIARVLVVLLGVQLLAGSINVLLLAPVWLQLVHLLLADLIWIAYIVIAAESLSLPAQVHVVAVRVPRTA